ncbi:MAG TPA: lysylphosphatidylglycerol synthase transmembrane domain-containing protein [Armatimonadota bacterium]
MTGPRRLLPLIVVLALVALFAFRNNHELREAVRILQHARSGPLMWALAAQILYYAFATLTVRQCLRLVDFDIPFAQSLRATFLLIFVNRIVPGPAATGPAAMYLILGRRGLDKTRAAFVGPMFYAVDYAAFFLLLLLGVLSAILNRQDVRSAVAAIPIVGVAVVVAWAALRMWRRPERVRRFLTRWRDALNATLAGLRLKARLPANGPDHVAETVAGMRDRLDRHPGIGWKMGFAGVAMLLSDVVTMALCLSAFGYSPSVSTALLGFCLATVGAIISFLPGGLGTFEIAMVAGFGSLGVPRPVALAGTLAYRIIATWLPAALGVFASGELARPKANRDAG